MKIQKIFFSVLFLLIAVFAFSKGAYAAAGWCPFNTSTPSVCCTNLYPGGDCLDVFKNWYVGTSCLTDEVVITAISNAATAKRDYNCATGDTRCSTGYCLNGTICQTPVCAGSSCAACNLLFQVSNTCTGACGPGCLPGYEMSGGSCIAVCGTGEIRAPAPNSSVCLSLDKVSKILAKTFGGLTLANLMSTYQTIIDNMTANPSYYLLTSQGTGVAPSPFVGQRLYQYGHGTGDTTDKVRLESDYSDMSWALDPANATYAILQEVITEWTGLNLCQIDADCTVSGETCVGYFCQALGADGDVCTDNSDCAAGLYCNAGVCAAIGGVGAAAADYLGVSNNSFSASIGYVGANAECASSYATKTDVHVCMSSEILDNINRGVDSALGLAAGNAVWINNGPPAFTANANDCRGWTQPNASYYGTTWVIMGADGVGGLSKCNVATYKFACCGTN